MAEDQSLNFIHSAFQLVAEADLSIGFIKGTGLGAILLTVIAIVLIRSRTFSRSRFSDLIKAWRDNSAGPPAR